MKIAIIGADGQLGSDLVRVFSEDHAVHPLTISDVRVEEADRVLRVLTAIGPDAVLNTAAYHRVPDCETHQDTAWQVNGRGALNVAQAAEALGVVNVYFSTDYVFDGSKQTPYVETDCPNPQSVYAATKLLGEYFTRNYSARHFVVRISGIYGRTPSLVKGDNFITAILRQVASGREEIRVVDDEILSPTPTLEIARNTLSLLDQADFGVYHMTCGGACSWFDFTEVIFETLQIETPLVRCSVSDFPAAVKRPAYSVLENAGLKRLGIDRMPHWEDALVRFIREQYPEPGRYGLS
ncbi:MAG TPA: dTDP-4-dehydrorhamnose reductase [bacterium]|nr:dTDP-4-dehydrorhamnose reductase [bacterium]